MSAERGIISYSSADYEFLQKNLGFTDDTPDGVLTKKEFESDANKSFRDFFANNLSAKEKAILASFTSERPLTKRLVAYDHGLMHIALKHIRFEENLRIIDSRGLPRTPDETRLNFNLRPQAGFLVNRLTLDIPQIRAGLSPESWQLLMNGNLSAYKTNTLKVLRHFLKARDANQPTDITFEQWQSAYAGLVGCSIVENRDSIESTWNEMIRMWQDSDTLWHAGVGPGPHLFWSAADEIYETGWGGLARAGRVETAKDEQGKTQIRLRITAQGVAAHIDHPENAIFTAPRPPSKLKNSPLTRATLAWETAWPANTATQITLGEKLGLALHLDAKPGATITAYQEVQKSDLAFHAGRPLLRFNGFALNVDTSHFITKALSKAVNGVTGLFGKRYDVEALTPLALTVYQNRLCFVLQGQNHHLDLIKPLGSDFLFLDATPFIRDAIKDLDGSGRLNKTFFNDAGEIYSDVSVAELTEAILAALEHKTLAKKASSSKLTAFESWRHRFFAEDVTVDFSHLVRTWQADFAARNDVPNAGLKINMLRLEDGKFAGSGTVPQNFVLDGQIKMTLALADNSSTAVGTHNLLSVMAETHFDTGKRAGYVRLKLPETPIKGLGKSVDGNYSGEILIGLDLKNEDLFVDGRFSLDRFLAGLSLATLVDLKKNHHDFLLAAFELTEVVTSPETKALEKIAARFNLALMDHGQELYGIIHDGQITTLKTQDDNIFTNPKITAGAADVMIGGLVQLFGKNAVLTVYRDPDGTIHIEPTLDALSHDGPEKFRAKNMAGEILVKPPAPDSRQKNYQITFKNFRIDLQNAEIETPDVHARGETRGVLNGTMSVRADSFLDIFRTDEKWHGKGKLEFTGKRSSLKILNAAKTVSGKMDGAELGVTVEFETLQFLPFATKGTLATRLRDADVNVDTPLLNISGKLNGAVRVKGGLPLIKFTAAGVGTNDADTNVPELPEFAPLPHILPQDFNESEFLDKLITPLVDAMIRTPTTDMGLSYLFNRNFQYDALAGSINDLTFVLKKLPLALEADYEPRKALKGRQTIRIPLFSGLLNFLNPHIEKNSFLYTKSTQALTADGTLQEFRIDLNQPIRFFGFNITGIGVAESLCSKAETLPLKVYEFQGLSPKQRDAFTQALQKLYPDAKTPAGNLPALLRFANEAATDPLFGETFRKNPELFSPSQADAVQKILDENALILKNKNGDSLTPDEYKKIIANNHRLLNLYLTEFKRHHHRLVLFTRHGRLDLMALIRLRYLFSGKVTKLYKNLRKLGIKVRPGEIPSNMQDFGHFLKGLIALFEFDKSLKKDDHDEARPLEAYDFEALSRNQMGILTEALKKLALPGTVPASGNRTAVLRFINEAAMDPRLAETFKKNLNLFAPPQAGEAEDVSDENLLVLFNKNGAALTQDEHKKIIANNYRLMHLYLAPFLEQPDWLDFNHSEDLSLDANLTPKKASYNIVEFVKDATTPFDLRLDYNPTTAPFDLNPDDNPTDAKERVVLPGTYLQVANKPDDVIENARFNYKLPSLYFKGDFKQIQGLNYYLGRPTAEHSADYSISLSDFVLDDLEMTYMPPSVFNKPAFALFKADPNFAGVSNHFIGKTFKIDRFKQEVHSDVHVLRAAAPNSYAYFYLGEPEEARDMFLDLAGADLWDVETDILHHYNPETRLYLASFSKINGYINLDNQPDDRPRGLIYLGTTDEGVRRHMILNKLEAKGRFDVVDDDLHAEAHIGFIATLPDYIYDAPVTRSLRDKGVDFKIQTVELDGTMDMILNKTHGGFKKSQLPAAQLAGGEHKPALENPIADIIPLLPTDGHLDDVTLKLKGSFRFQSNGSWVTLTDLTVPVDECLLKLTTEHTATGTVISSVALDSLQIPAGRAFESGVDMNIRTKPGSPAGAIHLEKGRLRLTSKSPFSYYMDQQNVPGFQTDGLDLSLSDAENRLDLSTGRIRYLNKSGTVESVKISGEVINQIIAQLGVAMAFEGRDLKFELK